MHQLTTVQCLPRSAARGSGCRAVMSLSLSSNASSATDAAASSASRFAAAACSATCTPVTAVSKEHEHSLCSCKSSSRSFLRTEIRFLHTAKHFALCLGGYGAASSASGPAAATLLPCSGMNLQCHDHHCICASSAQADRQSPRCPSPREPQWDGKIVGGWGDLLGDDLRKSELYKGSCQPSLSSVCSALRSAFRICTAPEQLSEAWPFLLIKAN